MVSTHVHVDMFYSINLSDLSKTRFDKLRQILSRYYILIEKAIMPLFSGNILRVTVWDVLLHSTKSCANWGRHWGRVCKASAWNVNIPYGLLSFPGCSTSDAAPCWFFWVKQWSWPKCLGTCHPCGRPKWNYWPLAYTWPKLRFCGHVGSESIHGVSLSCPSLWNFFNK